MNLLTRLTNPGPKRILALDGGGIKGAMTLGFLKRIEDILRVRHNNSKLLLSDYFDLIGGTSTGSIIAALLAVGKTVEEVQLMYQDMGGEIFDDRIKFNPLGLFAPKFKSKPLKERLEMEFGEMKIDSEKIRTGLCIVTKRLDTGGTWPIINHPGAKYFKDNRDILLRDAVRASTAAPSYFEPEKLRVKIDQEGICGWWRKQCQQPCFVYVYDYAVNRFSISLEVHRHCHTTSGPNKSPYYHACSRNCAHRE